METTHLRRGYHDLQRLHRWLAYELSTPVLLLAWYVIPGNVVLLALKVLAVAFTPFMLRTLYRVERRGWIVGFLVTVGGTFTLSLIPVEGLALGFVLGALPLVTFYVYCWVLRHSVEEWLEEMRWKAKYEFHVQASDAE